MTEFYDEWNDYAREHVIKMAKKDADYQQLLDQCNDLTPEYLSICEELTPEQQEILDRYISCCEEMEYRMAQLAYEFGKAAVWLSLAKKK